MQLIGDSGLVYLNFCSMSDVQPAPQRVYKQTRDPRMGRRDQQMESRGRHEAEKRAPWSLRYRHGYRHY